MRITIEMSGAGSDSAVIRRESGADAMDETFATEQATDAGPPPESLVLALEPEAGPDAGPVQEPRGGSQGGGEGNGPPAWLRDVIDGGAPDVA